MTYPDTPDGQRGEVTADQLIATFNGGVATGTVEVPINAKALWMLLGPMPDPTVTVTGVSTGIVYPTYALWTQDVAGELNLCAVCFVTSQFDEEVSIHWASAPAGAWSVIADTGGRFTLDAALAASSANPGTVIPGYAVLMGGSDGTDIRALLVDSTGRLVVAGSTFPPVYGTPGAALPADALAVGGTDGTDLRVLAVDTSGHLLTIDSHLGNVTGAPGSAEPPDALQVAGSDGIDLRTLLTDATGRLLVVEQALELVIAALGAAHPADALQVAGNDGTDLRALLTDATGILSTADQNLKQAIALGSSAAPNHVVQIGGFDGTDLRAMRVNQGGLPYMIPSAPATAASDHPPNELLVAQIFVAQGSNILAAPGAGKRYRVFSMTLEPIAFAANTEGSVTDGANVIAIFSGATGGARRYSFGPSGFPMATNAPIEYVNVAGAGFVIAGSLTYTLETA